MRSPSCSGFAGKIFNNTSETTVFRLSGLTCISCCTVFRQPSHPHSQKPFDRPEEYPRIRFHPRMFRSYGKSRLMVCPSGFSHLPVRPVFPHGFFAFFHDFIHVLVVLLSLGVGRNKKSSSFYRKRIWYSNVIYKIFI